MRLLKIIFLFLIICVINTQQLEKLYTRKRNGRFTPILNRNGQVTRHQYKGGIFRSQDGVNFYPIHKRGMRGWVRRRRNPGIQVVVPPVGGRRGRGQPMDLG